MADIKFACPQCKQNIKCDELWAGHSLQCPSCQSQVTVPQIQAAPAPVPPAPPLRPVAYSPKGSMAQGPPPPPSAQSRLSLGRPQHQAESDAGAPARTGPVYRNYVAPIEKKSGGLVKWLKIAAVLIALGVGGYFGFNWVMAYQEKANAKRREIEKNSDGGELGHIANVYQTLDATDPNRPLEGSSRSDLPGRPRSGGPRSPAEPMGPGDATAAKPEEKELPALPAVWTLDALAAKIPEGRVNGKISGTNFVAETARLDVVGTSHVLRLTQGSVASPERELLIYLRPKAGSAIPGNSWTITKDTKGPGVPQVTKRWKTNPKFAPQQKNFASGYVMKLELGPLNEGTVSGKIFVALPDPEKTVVAGLFKATTSLGDPNAQVVPTQPVQPRAPAPGGRPMESRYGVSPGLP